MRMGVNPPNFDPGASWHRSCRESEVGASINTVYDQSVRNVDSCYPGPGFPV
jgi:hypothetical protein